MTGIYLVCMYQLYQRHHYCKTIEYASELQMTCVVRVHSPDALPCHK